MWLVSVVAIAAAVGSGFVMTAAGGAAPQTKAAGTVLCTANGTKPLGNTGVVNVSVKGKGSGSSGAPVSCSGKLTGKWVKNSTQFSWDASGPTTVGQGGAFKALSGVVMGPKGKVAGTVTGLPTGTAITVDVGCDISYPPLKIRCWIIISSTA